MPGEYNGITYPLFYFSRRDVSDRDWIFQRMAVIPKSKQLEVAEEYERLFLRNKPNGRKPANTYLHEIASYYRDKRKEGLANARSQIKM